MKKALFAIFFILSLTGCNEPEPEYQAVMNFIKAVSLKNVQAVDSMLWVNSAQRRAEILGAVSAGDIPLILSKTTHSTFSKAFTQDVGVTAVNFNLTFCTIKIESNRGGSLGSKRYENKICSFSDSYFKKAGQ